MSIKPTEMALSSNLLISKPPKPGAKIQRPKDGQSLSLCQNKIIEPHRSARRLNVTELWRLLDSDDQGVSVRGRDEVDCQQLPVIGARSDRGRRGYGRRGIFCGHNDLRPVGGNQPLCFNITRQVVMRAGPRLDQLANFIIEGGCVDTVIGDFERALSRPCGRSCDPYPGVLALAKIPIELSEVITNRRFEALIPY